jgi:hypothetical protein
MPIVRVNDRGRQLGRFARLGALLATGVVVTGAVLYFRGDPNLGLLVCVIGNSLAAVWNLADNS